VGFGLGRALDGNTARELRLKSDTLWRVMNELVTVASFGDVSEAELAKERLELDGVRAFVIDAQTAGVMPFVTSSTGGVRVQVEPKDLARAKDILGV